MNAMGHMSARTFLLKKLIPSGMTVKPSQTQEELGKEAHIDVFCLQVSCQSTPKMPIYRISANSFRGNYSFLSLALCTVTFDHST